MVGVAHLDLTRLSPADQGVEGHPAGRLALGLDNAPELPINLRPGGLVAGLQFLPPAGAKRLENIMAGDR